MSMAPLSKEFLLSRGSCCNNGCLNCPYGESLTKRVEKENDIRLSKSLTEKSGADGGRRKEAD